MPNEKNTKFELPTLWSPEEITSLFGRVYNGRPISGISIDSRTVTEGDLFIALTGDNESSTDGHEFVGKAISSGAVAAMIHQTDIYLSDGRAIKVDDTSRGLWSLGHSARSRCQRAIAITGSSGKTTLRFWLETLLRGVAPTHASVGSYNNHWGVPLSLARMPHQTTYGVFEIGTNHPGEIAPLTQLVHPDVAVLLNVLPAHIANFRDMDDLLSEKLSIFSSLDSDGWAILPYALASHIDHKNKITFGFDERSDVFATWQEHGKETRISAVVFGRAIELIIPMLGRYRVESCLAILAILSALKIEPDILVGWAANLDIPEGRGRRHQINGITLIDDSYNANPVSMTDAIEGLSAVKPGRAIALLGEMLELGEHSHDAHEAVGRACKLVDTVWTIGTGFLDVAASARTHHHLNDVSDFDLKLFAKNLVPGDVVLIKGSNKVFWQKGFVEKLRSILIQTSQS